MSHAHERRIILTPGPVATSARTRQAMLRDFTPNEPDLLALTAEMRARLVALAHGQDRYVCVPIQGVGNTANEAALGTLVRRDRKLLIVDNGFYGARLKQIAVAIGVPFAALELPWTEPVTGARLEAARMTDDLRRMVANMFTPAETPAAEVAVAQGVPPNETTGAAADEASAAGAPKPPARPRAAPAFRNPRRSITGPASCAAPRAG